jgi:hypothetical protein
MSGWLTRAGQRKSDTGARRWMGVAFCAAVGLAAAVLTVMGTGDQGISMALRLTGRLSFLFFWPAYAGSAVAFLFGRRFGIITRFGREFGLAYASAQLVHLALVGWLVWRSREPAQDSIMPFFAIGIAWTYILAFSSVRPLQQLFDRDLWRIFRHLGLEYIALVFFADFVFGPIENGVQSPIEYLPFALLLISGSLLRMAVMVGRTALGKATQ